MTAMVLPYNPTQILCPMDRSELSDLALKYAAAGARVFNAQVTVLEAVHYDYPRYLSKDLTTSLLRELSHYKKSAEKDLAAHVRSVLGKTVDTISIRYRILDLEPAQAIRQMIEETRSELVVMGTHGYSGFAHWRLGSVTEGVLQTGRIPLFTVRQKIDGFIDPGLPEAEPRIQEILCPCNFTPAAAAALQIAASLADRFGARLTAVFSPESHETAHEEQFRKWLSETLPSHPDVRCLVKPGEAADRIISAAKETGTDLIVIGARYRLFGGASVMGRTTELVLRHAPVPVLSVPFVADGE